MKIDITRREYTLNEIARKKENWKKKRISNSLYRKKEWAFRALFFGSKDKEFMADMKFSEQIIFIRNKYCLFI